MEAFRRACQDAIGLYSELQTAVVCVLNACNEQREFPTTNEYFRGAQRYQKQIAELLPVLRDLQQKATFNDDRQQREANKLIAFLESVSDASSFRLIDVFSFKLSEKNTKDVLGE